MKLRLKGNAIRFRVSRSESERLLRGDRVEDAIQFSAAPESRLAYGLQALPQSKTIDVQWAPHRVTVLLSEERIKLWSKETEVGIYESVDLGAAGSLVVSIEKDFACLDRNDEDNADSFANPRASCA